MNPADTHAIERAIVTEKNEISRDFLDTVLDDLGERPDLLPTVFRREIQLAAGLGSDAHTASHATAELIRAARTAALMFVHAWHRNESTFIALDAALDVELRGEIDPSFVNAPAWIEAMWCALACGDDLAQQWLSTVPPSQLAPPGVEHGRYAFATGELLRSLVTGDGRHGDWFSQAIEASDDESDPVLALTREWVDTIELPALRAAFHWLAEDARGFEQALVELHTQHRRQWSSAENALAVDGLLSLRGCALLRLAARSRLTVGFASGYMPRAVWQTPASPHDVRCPYCIAPLSARAPACGPCGRALADAPIEVPAPGLGPRTACARCAHPLHALAVLCPRCRTARR